MILTKVELHAGRRRLLLRRHGMSWLIEFLVVRLLSSLPLSRSWRVEAHRC